MLHKFRVQVFFSMLCIFVQFDGFTINSDFLSRPARSDLGRPDILEPDCRSSATTVTHCRNHPPHTWESHRTSWTQRPAPWVSTDATRHSAPPTGGVSARCSPPQVHPQVVGRSFNRSLLANRSLYFKLLESHYIDTKQTLFHY